MKRLLALVLFVAALAVVVPVGLATSAGATFDYTQLQGNLSVVASTPTSVSLLVTQTAGDPVTLVVEHVCYAGTTYAGLVRLSVVSGDVVTVDVGPRKYHGKLLTPTWCQANLVYQINPQQNDWVHVFTLEQSFMTLGVHP